MSQNSDMSAIDGESKEARNFREGNMGMGGTVYTPAEEAIRPDVQEVLDQSKKEFQDWYKRRMLAVKEELERYELICSIPDLHYGSQENDLSSNTGMRNHLEVLQRGKKYLEALKEKWEEIHGKSLFPKN